MSDNRLINWLTGNDTGSSSKMIVKVMEGENYMNGFWATNHPSDPDDLGRCIRLLEIMPEYRERLSEMGEVTEVWKALVEHWEELEKLYQEELPTGKAPKCYARMQEIIENAEKEMGGYSRYGATVVHLNGMTLATHR